jgi:hypothetical protein
MDDLEREEKEAEETLESIVTQVLVPEGALLTGYVLIAEYVVPESGLKELATDYSSDMAPWLRDGMLLHARRYFEIQEQMDAVYDLETEEDGGDEEDGDL